MASEGTSNFGRMVSVDFATSIRKKLAILQSDIKDIRDHGRLACSDASQINLFKGMASSLTPNYNTYNDLFHQLNDLMDETSQCTIVTDNDFALRNDVRRYVHETNSYLLTLKPAETTGPNNTTSSATTSGCGGSHARAKLPTINLPPFDGDRTKWPRYRDLFQSVVIGDDQLRDIDRFHYLIASIKGPPASIIAKLPLTEENFNLAWESLREVYDNQRLLASTYIDQLLELKPLSKTPSTEEFSDRIATLSESVAAIKLLKIPNTLEFIFFHLASRTLDPETVLAFENANPVKFPTFDSLLEFLRKRSTAAQLAARVCGTSSSQRSHNKPSTFTKGPSQHRSVLLSSQPQPKQLPHHVGLSVDYMKPPASQPTTASSKFTKPSPCPACRGPHTLGNCLRFSNASSQERHHLLRDWKGCRNCLSPGHNTGSCQSKWRCRFCKNKHHTLLHVISSANHTLPSGPMPSGFSKDPKPAALNVSAPQPVGVLLGTLRCLLGASSSTPQPVRVVIDSGSQFTFITLECASRIGLHIEPHHTAIWGIGETPLVGFKGQTHCILSPISTHKPILSTHAMVVETITSPLPGFDIPSEIYQSYLSYNLADPQFWMTSSIDVLLGCDLFGEILTGEVITLKPELPKLLGTIFGYSVLGRFQDISEASLISALSACRNSSEDDSLAVELRRFWDLEEPPAASRINPDDVKCERLFQDTHYRLPSGRYVVRLPFTSSNPQFVGTKGVALKRLNHLENKLARNSLLKTKYGEFLQEYLDLGHMEVAANPGLVYIPHHCVVKGEGSDIKIRVVFDAAARSSTGSLNDALLVGPKLQSNLVDILLSFRRHPYVFTADAVKMYRQILVHPDDRRFQHILWRFDPAESVQDYELMTVSYGQSCAPYLALRVVRQLIADEGNAFPLAADALAHDMFVDDIVTGAYTIEEALQLQREVIGLMAKGGFSLDKWATNHPLLLAACQKSNSSEVSLQSSPVPLENHDDNVPVKILGLQWDPVKDEFLYKISPPPPLATKRAVLSAVAKMYDPLGYLGPTVVKAKLIVQEAWKLRLAWDEPLPEDLDLEWTSLVTQLPILTQLRIPRWILPTDTVTTRILIFADASEKAYCASAYLHASSLRRVSCHLILAKTKLAPVKAVTIPRLELCAALLGARLDQSLQPFYNRLPRIPERIFFSDSTVVLGWLQTPTFKLKTFVANRVEKILDITAGQRWNHVVSEDNPSDLGSRGLFPPDLIKNALWLTGPSWAQLLPSSWPNSTEALPKDLPELKPIAEGHSLLSSSLPTANEFPLIFWMERFSSLSKMLRSLCYIIRFTNRLKGGQPTIGTPSLSELRQATHICIKATQAHGFFAIPHIDATTSVVPKGLANLNPFFDESGVLLVGGRLDNSSIPWSCKHPILLPPKSHFAYLVIQDYHRNLLHPGPTVLLAVLRTKYWVVGARRVVRKLSQSCVKCRKLNASTCQPIMGNLPRNRFNDGRAFLHVGVDFAGPFQMRESLRRKSPQTKAYFCIFVCLSTKAVHLEAVTDLSTAAFCGALERFIARRGLPEKILSDNGTNFVGAANSLKELYIWLRQSDVQEAISTFTAQKEVEWVFNPPHAPSMGGIWEAGVKAAKRLMKGIYGDNIFTYEELATWLSKIEAILNSRPLCPLSNDPNDLSYLSPGHFLIGSPLLAVPEKSLVEIPENRLTRWQLVSQKTQHFWQRWRREYLATLQERTKWKTQTYNFQIGDLVIIKDEGTPRLQWPLARVQEVHPGPDQVVRVVTVRSQSNVLKRPANKLIPLFFPDPNSDYKSLSQ